jgi:diguanylate cyclase (GGDEF)-like protein/PAS domain S-box-containing protein
MIKKSDEGDSPLSRLGHKLDNKSMPIKINLVFLVVSFFYILFSDNLVAYLFTDSKTLMQASIYKGWVYVAAVAVMQYFLMKKWVYRVETMEKRLSESYLELEKTHAELQKSNKELFDSDEKLRKQYEELSELNEKMAASEEELLMQYDELLESRNRLELSEERYRTLVESSQDAICSCDTQGVIIATNRNFEDMFNAVAGEIVGRKLTDLIKDPSEAEVINALLNDVLKTGKPVGTSFETLQNDMTKKYYTTTMSPVIERNGGRILGVTVTHHDVTEIMISEEIIRHMAYYDSLTDIPNRQLFCDRLNIALSHAKRTSTKVAVAFMDIDDFKKINDSMGHFAGDELLKSVSSRLIQHTRSNETAARFSGDEFTILIQGISQDEEVLNFIERVFGIFDKTFLIEGNEIKVRLSVGIAIYPKDGTTAEEILRHSDEAMYTAKRKGKDTYHIYGT